MRNRIVRALVIIAPTLLLLTGCIDTTLTTTIDNNGTGTQSATVMTDTQALKIMGKTPDEVLDEMRKTALEADPDTRLEEIRTDDQVGMKMSRDIVWDGDGINIADTPSEVGQMHILRTGDQITASLNLVPINQSGAATEEDFEQVLGFVKSMYDSYDITIIFPGQVVEATHGGVVDGNTVTWNIDSVLNSVKTREPLSATAETSIVPLWVVYAITGTLIFVALAGVVTLVIIRRRKSRHTLPEVSLADSSLAPNLDAPIFKPTAPPARLPSNPKHSPGLPSRKP